MAEYIQSADLTYYNANDRGSNVGDCVKRSMSLAFDLPYAEISKLLNQKTREISYGTIPWNSERIYPKVIEDLGGPSHPTRKPEYRDKNNGVTLEQFVDESADPNGIYLVLTSKKPGEAANHIVCVRQGVIYDSWDSRDQYVSGYYKIERNSVKELTDIKSKLKDLAKEYAEPEIYAEVLKFAEKKHWETETIQVAYVGKVDYAFQINGTIVFSPCSYSEKKRKYNFKVVVATTPTMTEDEVIELIHKLAKVRTYDRCYAIQEKENELKKAAETLATAPERPKQHLVFFDSRTERFFDNLPKWVQPLVTWVNVQRPNEFNDSYDMTIWPLPGDTRHPQDKEIEFHDYTAGSIKEQLAEYKRSYMVGWEDYEV